jgi:hypothetical protein
MERFIKEYASHKIKDITNNELMKKELKNDTIDKINKVLKLRVRGLITIDETIKVILNT